MSKRPDQDYIDFDPYMDECTVKCSKVKIVTTRKAQTCFMPTGKIHQIPVGTRARYETAIVDGEWGRYYTCLECLDRYMDEYPDVFPLDVKVGEK